MTDFVRPAVFLLAVVWLLNTDGGVRAVHKLEALLRPLLG